MFLAKYLFDAYSEKTPNESRIQIIVFCSQLDDLRQVVTYRLILHFQSEICFQSTPDSKGRRHCRLGPATSKDATSKTFKSRIHGRVGRFYKLIRHSYCSTRCTCQDTEFTFFCQWYKTIMVCTNGETKMRISICSVSNCLGMRGHNITPKTKDLKWSRSYKWTLHAYKKLSKFNKLKPFVKNVLINCTRNPLLCDRKSSIIVSASYFVSFTWLD